MYIHICVYNAIVIHVCAYTCNILIHIYELYTYKYTNIHTYIETHKYVCM